jgi:hypothetical protein
MPSFHTSLIVWGAWFFLVLGSFLVLEIFALSDRVAWNTLTWTFRQLFTRNQLFGLAFVAGAAALVVHMFWKRVKRDEPEGRN